MQLGTFSARIVIDEKPLEEYDIVSNSPTEATCWIASEEGKSFGVRWECHEESRIKGSEGRVIVDGVNCGMIVLSPGILGEDNIAIHSVYVDKTTKRDLVFTRIQLTDDDSLLEKDVPEKFGQIRLIIRRGEVVKRLRHINHGKDKSVELGDNKFHEKFKKATVHCVGFGPERVRELPKYQLSVTPNNEPVMTFVFNYQPLSVLQANGIAPRPVVNEDISEDVKPSELHDRLHSLENELKRVRELIQANDSDGRQPKRIKREQELDEQGRERRVFAPGEVIDLI